MVGKDDALGMARETVRFCQDALRVNGDQPGLLANLALAYLIDGDLEQAQQIADEAVAAAPTDAISAAIASLIAAHAMRSTETPLPALAAGSLG